MQHTAPTTRGTTLALLATGALILGACQPQLSHLERIKQKGELVVATHSSHTTYFHGPNGPSGLEFDLASRLARQLGVKLRMVAAERQDKVLALVATGQADIGAGVVVTPEPITFVRYTHPYRQLQQQLIYRRGNDEVPENLNQLKGGRLEVGAGSIHADTLRSFADSHPQLHWSEATDPDTESLLRRVWERELDYTVANSDEAAYVRRFYPELRIAFDIADPLPLAWALPLSTDDTLYQAVQAFLQEAVTDGTLAQLEDRYFGHVEEFDYVQTRVFLRHLEKRLPRFEPHFLAAAKKYEVDWRLLAAMGYQESAWNPRAISPTGVRGIMMLTLATAAHVGIKNRLDPGQSILGGARYFSRILRQIPERIPDPDRTWMALAAYNVGFGHLEDARRLAEHLGMDPDRWVDVKKTLPLLREKKWYTGLKFGYARGDEAVVYVERIRDYYDQLVRRFPDAGPRERVADEGAAAIPAT
ncbi:MAG: membrane-bound lytic murein transglycosylase MltF [Gammaproteobacteria bacterium]